MGWLGWFFRALPNGNGFGDEDLDHVVPGPRFADGNLVNFFKSFRHKPDADLFFTHKNIIGRSKKRLNVIESA